MTYKFGLKPVVQQPKLQLVNYLRPSDLPSVGSLPTSFGHADLIQPQMFLNNVLGDCAIAGSIEEIRLLNATRGVTVNFTDHSAVKNYSAITGYKPGPELNNPDAPPNPTDQGTDVHDLFAYRQKTGLVDADGKHHQVAAWVGLTPGNWDELLVALSLFEVVGIGIQVPDYAERQFEAGQPWHVLRGRHSIVGGHYIPVVSRDDATTAGVFTWGAKTGITESFYRLLNNVAVVAFTTEMLMGTVTIDGVDQASLLHDLVELNTGTVADKAPRHDAA